MKTSKYVAVESLQELKAATGRKVLIGGGEMVYATMNARTDPPKGFIAQRPREAAMGLLASFKKDTPKVYTYVNPSLVGWDKTRFAALIDTYVAWGVSWARHLR